MLLADPNLALLLSLLALGAMGLVLLRYRTVLLGFTFFSFFNIASASLTAFLVATGFNLSSPWLTADHLRVINYSAVGLLAFSAGVWLAWRPLAGKDLASIWQIQTSTPRLPSPSVIPYINQAKNSLLPWLNLRFAMLCLGLSVAIYALTPAVYAIPTFRAVWSNLYSLLPLGLLAVLLVCQISRNYAPLIIAFLIFIPVALSSAVNTGHIGVGGSFMFQLLLVATFALGIRVRTLPLFAIGTIILTSLLVGWLASRSLIRSGELSQYGQIDRIEIFVREFAYISPFELTPEQVQEMVRMRVDMTDLLASQVFYQPRFEPYANGTTIINELAASLVPRFLWPDKPSIVGGSAFVTRFTGMTFAEGTSVGLPYQFELYANGGVPVVIVGLFILGWLTARLELYTVTRPLSLPWFLVLMNSTYVLANGGQTIVVVLVTLIAGSIGYYVLGILLLRFNLVYGFWQEPMILQESIPQRLRPTSWFKPTTPRS
ncbi:MAG: hypothetical protein AB4911_24005 [Oscillochloridaceae bacterium umkhey_bin13]